MFLSRWAWQWVAHTSRLWQCRSVNNFCCTPAYHCKGDHSDYYDFINLVMCFVNKSQIKFLLNILISQLSLDLISTNSGVNNDERRASSLFSASCLQLSIIRDVSLHILLERYLDNSIITASFRKNLTATVNETYVEDRMEHLFSPHC